MTNFAHTSLCPNIQYKDVSHILSPLQTQGTMTPLSLFFCPLFSYRLFLCLVCQGLSHIPLWCDVIAFERDPETQLVQNAAAHILTKMTQYFI